MAGWKGMNVDQAQGQGRELDQVSQQLGKIAADLDKEVLEIDQNWNGQDSTKFVNDWNSQYKTKLKNAQQLLQEMAQKVATEAKAQTATSNS